MSRISEIAREMKTWWSDEGSDIEVQDALDEIIRLDDAEQTEPQTDCEGCKFKSGVFCIVDGDCKYFNRYEPKDEPTISKMEQVDKDINVRSKDEPQTERSE